MFHRSSPKDGGLSRVARDGTVPPTTGRLTSLLGIQLVGTQRADRVKNQRFFQNTSQSCELQLGNFLIDLLVRQSKVALQRGTKWAMVDGE